MSAMWRSSRVSSPRMLLPQRMPQHFGLPDNLNLSVHSGSNKFSIYSAIHDAMKMNCEPMHTL